MDLITQRQLLQTRRQFFGDVGLRLGGTALAMMLAIGGPASAAAVGGDVTFMIAPRTKGFPRPVSDPSSERPSEKPMLIPAPTAAASPTRNVTRVLPLANAVANNGASVETDPSINPTRLGCTTRSTKFLLCPEAVISLPPSPNRSSQAAKDSPPKSVMCNSPQHSNRPQQ